MKTVKIACWVQMAALLSVVVQPLASYGAPPVADDFPPAEESADSPLGQRLGAPQVLEIPPQGQEPSSATRSSQEDVPSSAAPPRTVERTEPPIVEPPARTAERFPQPEEGTRPGARTGKDARQRNYLGVLYATTEEGPTGVKVLDVVPGSPAERAGFSGANRPSEGQSSLIKAAIVVLAMSPAGPFAIPLAIAHDMYMTQQTPGDVIVAINEQPVRNAQEFSEMMRRYKPQETVVFSILRSGKPKQISVQLEEEPA